MVQRILTAVSVFLGLYLTAVSGAWAAPPSREELRKLVEQLGSERYEVRERATRALLDQGLAARDVLMEALKHPDLEVRMRAHHILAAALQSQFEAQLADFVAGKGSEEQYDFPGWRAFRKIVGSTPESRQLFAEMLRRERDLLELVDSPTAAAERAFAQRVEQTFQELIQGQSARMRVSVAPASIAALLLASSSGDNVNDFFAASRVYNLLNLPATQQAVLNSPESPLLRRMLNHWVEQSSGGNQAYYALMVVLNYDLQESGLALARKLLQEPAAMPVALQYAAIIVGRFGGREDIPLLERHINNKTVCHTFNDGNREYRTQVRDVMLAMILHLAGEDPKDFGYEILQKDPRYIYRIYTFGFSDETTREHAFAKWRQWKQQQG